MNFLQYRSDEMISSTQLIRKSKTVFDKVSKGEIEKAVILRDGKPSFLLMDFAQYEKIMKEYIQLKTNTSSVQKSISSTQIKEEEKSVQKEIIKDDDLEIALKKIEEIELEETKAQEKQNLKEFWE
jgi:hypothetical protein